MQNLFLDSWASGDLEIDVCGCMCVHTSNGKVIQNVINTCRIGFWTAGRREISKSMSAAACVFTNLMAKSYKM